MDINEFAKFYEIPSLPFQDTEKPNCGGWMDNVNPPPPTNTVCRGYNKPEAHEPQCSPEWTAIKAYFNILDFQLPWQQIKMRNLYNFFMLGGGLLNKHL